MKFIKKKLSALPIAFICISLLCMLTACCSHSWTEANCDTPKTCEKCGETEGEALGHSFSKATCVEAEKCTVCQKIEGEPLGHNFAEANCQSPEKCMYCGLTQGEKIEHVFSEATCTTVKICQLCGTTEGSALGHTTLFGNCERCAELVLELKEEARYISDNLADVLEDFTSGVNCASYNPYGSFTYFLLAKEELDGISRKCGDYEEFSQIKTVVQTWIDRINSYPEHPTQDQYVNWALGVFTKDESFAISDALGEFALIFAQAGQ